MKYRFSGKQFLAIAFIVITNTCIAQLSPFTIGTIPANDSIVIYYDVTINTPCGCSQISNQGAISGSNFSNLVTNDPDTGPANDATITSLNLFPLPVTLIEFKAYQKNNGIELTWRTEEINVNRYEIERSSNGSSFIKIATSLSIGNGTHNYTSNDPAPYNGNNFYRLKIIDFDGKMKYSPIVRVDLNRTDLSLSVFPNPVNNRLATVQYCNILQGIYELWLINNAGQIVYNKRLEIRNKNGSETIRIPENISAGIYNLKLIGQENLNTRIIIQH